MPTAALAALLGPGDWGWAEPICRRLVESARSPRQGLDLLAALGEALDQAADPRAALTGFDRWQSHLVTPAVTHALLLEHPRLLRDLLVLFGASGYLSDILARDPESYVLFAAPQPVHLSDYPRFVAEALRSTARPDRARAALRRLRRRETLRTAWCDLAGGARLSETVAHVSALAAALIAGALTVARRELAPAGGPLAEEAVSMAVIAMGKLGGCELNYSSDVDLLFVYESTDPHDESQHRSARRLAERTIAILSEESAEGRLYRVDMRLRPEGRYGELARSLSGYREYYDRWIETWERQALIKARPVAGSRDLGERFMSLALPAAYRHAPDASLFQDVRDVKGMMERRASGHGPLNVKEGRGTIRDVEFAVQLLQLLFGEQRTMLRTANTQRALLALRRSRLLDASEARSLWDGYTFFRTVEHRLQLKEDLPVRELPGEPSEQCWLARLLGFGDWPAFTGECARRSDAVRATCDAIYARLGVGAAPAADDLRSCILALPDSEARAALSRRLSETGFRDPGRALTAVERLGVAAGGAAHPASTRRAFAELAPALLENCLRSADPDEALVGFQRLAERSVLYRQFYERFRDDPPALHDLCSLAGASPPLVEILLRHPEFLALALDRDELHEVRTRADLSLELDQRLIGAASRARRLESIRRFRTRHLVRLAARELLIGSSEGPRVTSDMPASLASPRSGRQTGTRVAGEAQGASPGKLERVSESPVGATLPPSPTPEDAGITTPEWTAVAEVCLAAALETVGEDLRRNGRWTERDAAGFAVIALGRFGGRELQFGSDLDLFFLFEPRGLDPQDYERFAGALLEALQEAGPDGPLFAVDLRLRPEGKSGFVASSEAACRRYYNERAQPWEFQTFLRARPVAGAEEVAQRLLAFLDPLIYPPEPPPEWREQVAEMRGRIERARVPREERDRNVKLGPGGLADVEFLVQYLQRLHGAAHPAVRTPGTLDALRALAAAGALPPADAHTLEDGYRFLNRLRQRLWLCLGEHRGDTLPTEPIELRRIALSLGFANGEDLLARYRGTTDTIRRVFARHLVKPEL